MANRETQEFEKWIADREKAEIPIKAEASRLIIGIKTELLAQHSGTIFERMSKHNPTLKRLTEQFGQKEQVQDFVVNEFFVQEEQNRDRIPLHVNNGQTDYVVTWTIDPLDRNDMVHIRKTNNHTNKQALGSKSDNESVTLGYPIQLMEHTIYEETDTWWEQQPTVTRDMEAKPKIDIFLADFLNPKTK
jgi:hypothetical protein